jgi:hypothetical protein
MIKRRADTRRRKVTTLQSRPAFDRTIRQDVGEAFAGRVAHAGTDAVEIFERALDDDYREFAKLGDALRALQLQLGRASLVRDGHMPSIDNADQRERRGAEILSAMTAGTCSVEGILTLVRLFDYHRLRARQRARRSHQAA